MEKANALDAEMAAIKQQLEMEEKYPEAVVHYTQIKEELEQFNEELTDMYGKLLMWMMNIREMTTNVKSVKTGMKKNCDYMKQMETENALNNVVTKKP